MQYGLILVGHYGDLSVLGLYKLHSISVYFYRLFFSCSNVLRHNSLKSSLASTSLGGNSDIIEPLINHDLLADLSCDHYMSTGHK